MARTSIGPRVRVTRSSAVECCAAENSTVQLKGGDVAAPPPVEQLCHQSKLYAAITGNQPLAALRSRWLLELLWVCSTQYSMSNSSGHRL